jgi:RNA polymerase sigma factor (sigma-70 family)
VGSFTATHWSMVLAAGGSDSLCSQPALEKLCTLYWPPLYAFVRRRGHTPPEAEDLVQEFFTRLLARNYLDRADAQKGRFRSFLLGSLKHFLADEWDRTHAQKRGGGCDFISRDAADAENSYALEPADNRTPDKLFEQKWAAALLEQVLFRLQEEFQFGGRGEVFERLKGFIASEGGPMTYTQAAATLGMTEGAAKMTVSRMRRRYREILRSEIAQTVATAEEIDLELRHLFTVLTDA